MRKYTLVLILWVLHVLPGWGQSSLGQQIADQHYQAGLDRMAHQQYGAAYSSFSKFLETHLPQDTRVPDAAYYRAFCSVTLLHKDGESMLSAFVADYPDHPRAVLAYYEMGNAFFDEKNYGKAASYYAKVDFKALNEEQGLIGRFRWGYSLFSQRNLLSALDQFNVVKVTGGQYGPAASYYSGFIELSVGDYDNASIDLRRAEKSTAYSTIVPPLIATVLQRQGKDDELIAYVEPLLDREDIATDDLSLLVAEAWYRKNNFGNAYPRYEDYLDGRENAPRSVYLRAGVAAHSVNKDENALTYLKRAASTTDSVGMHASYLLGTIYLQRNEKPLALTAFETSRKFNEDPALAEESLFLAAKINYDLGRPDVSINEFETILAQYPQSVHSQEIKELLAQAYINANNVNKAIAYIESLPQRSLAVDRAYQKATYLKGTEYFNKDEYAEAATLFEKSLAVPVDSRFVGEASFWLAETYSTGRRYEEAIPHYEKALTASGVPANLSVQIRYGLGYAHYNLQHYDRAIVSFRDYVSRGTRDPNYADGLLRLADCQYVLKSYGEALATYRKVIDMKSVDRDYAHLQCGKILMLQRQFGQAETELNAVASSGEARYADEARFQLGQLSLEQSNYSGAVSHFTTLIAAGQNNRYIPYALTRRATANYNLKNYGQTADDYIRVLLEFPTHPAAQDILLPLEESLRLAGRQDEFGQYLASYKEANPDAKGLETVEFETAKNLYFNQEYQRAINGLQSFLRGYPDSPQATEARYYLAESYYRQKDFPKSLELLNQVQQDHSFGMVTRAIARIGELEFRLQHYDTAVTAFQRLRRLAVNKKEEYTALSGLMESYHLLSAYDSSDVYARQIQTLGGVNASALSRASLFLGKNAKARGDYETAKDEFLNTFNMAQDENGAEAKYLLAEIFYLTGNHTMCFETLISLNKDFAAYNEWVGKSFLLLADNYIATKEIFQAKGTLQSLIDNFPLEAVRNKAAEKLKLIEASELNKQEAAKRDSTEQKP